MVSNQSPALPLPDILPRGERRYLMLSLPDWPTDFLRRHEPDLAGPLALYERTGSALRLAALSRDVLGRNLYVGQSLADARAILPDLKVREIDPAQVMAGFAALADWHSNASPLVAVHDARTPYGDLVLDITGVAHLFGGEAKMLDTLVTRLTRLGYQAQGAVASTIGAAWAASHFAPGLVVMPNQTTALLDTLPVGALRLDEEMILALMQLGLKRIGQVRAQDGKSLRARFGAVLTLRLGQAYGHVEERLTPRLPPAERYVDRRFGSPIGLMDDVLACARDLAIRLALRLEKEELGAQTFHLFLYQVDHRVNVLSVNAARPTRDPDHIGRLFANHVERLEGAFDNGFGIDMVRLAAAAVDRVPPRQASAFGNDGSGEALDRLHDRLTSRLGPFAVLSTRLVATHIPERMARLEPAITQSQDERHQDAPDNHDIPLRLLPVPEPITVAADVPDGPPAAMTWRGLNYRFLRATGPRRLSAEWWRSGRRLQLMPQGDPRPDRPAPHVSALPLHVPETVARDYYVAEDGAGRRFWLYRQGFYGEAVLPRWYLHGLFA